MLIGLSSYSFPWAVGIPGYVPTQPLTHDGLLERAIAWNVSAVQFGDNLPLDVLSVDEWKALRSKAEANGIQLEVGMRGLKPVNLKTYIRLAWEARSPFLRVVIDEGDFQPTVDEVMAIIKEKLPALRQAGVMLGIENHDRFSRRDLANIARKTDSDWVGFCVDTTNSMGAGESVLDVLDALTFLKVVNLHLKDFRAQRIESKMGFHVEGCEPGTGLLNIQNLLYDRKTYQLNKQDRPITLTLEQWPPFRNTLDETIAMELAWAEKGIQWIKQAITDLPK
ncbi:TIM barrel protein [Spirosoma sp. BT702]|uniref:TIM barrel protein n=1 Tax=Spirosoma profusum TaxID=2771354 RepID=A0A926XTI1_9BACT|nr:TIM barrel protein [Spirosoma profusum]MBD2699031.1 TIM barrel protein [Spirosoma profusum]